MRRSTRVPFAASALCSIAGSALGSVGPIEVIYEKRTGDPKSALPGWVNLAGAPEAVEWKAFEDLAVSADGSLWAVKARSTAAADHDVGIVLGSGTSGTVFNAGGTLIQEGQPAPTSAGTNGFIDFIASGFVRFDSNNKFVFGFRTRTTQTGATSSTDSMRVFTWDGSTLAFQFKQLDPYTGLSDTGAAGDETVGNSVGSFHLLDDGRIGSQDSTVNNISTTRRPVITYNRTAFHQTNVTSVTGLGGVGTVTWTTLTANSFYTTPDGMHWFAQGDAGSPALEVIVVDSIVALQENSPVGTSGLNFGTSPQVQMAASGQWIARGRDNSGTTAAAPDWVTINGQYVAKTGDPIFPGASENWGDTVVAVAINCRGDYIIAGNTNNPDPGRDNVIVFNGKVVVMREGDPVDLNGNGMFDDSVFIGRVNNTLTAFTGSLSNGSSSWWVTDDRMLYGLPMLRDGDGLELNATPAFGSPHALVRMRLACPADFNLDGAVSVQDIFDYLAAYFGGLSSANFNCVGGVTVQDIFDYLAAYFTPCP